MTESKDTSVASIRVCSGEVFFDHPAANEQPPPAPGFLQSDGALYYVSERGATWLIQDASGVVQLLPHEVPPGASDVEDDSVVEPDVLALAEVADGLGLEPGVYVHGEHYYCRTDDQSFLFYGARLEAVPLAAIPYHASILTAADVPDEVKNAVTRALEASA